MIKSNNRRQARHVARMGEVRNACNIFVGRLEGKDNFEDLGMDCTR
jgi:hypothetical protein